jgi:hypothetical protein
MGVADGTTANLDLETAGESEASNDEEEESTQLHNKTPIWKRYY